MTDQGTQFMSECTQEVSRLLSIKGLIKDRPYHPICNGSVERWNRTLKSRAETILKELWTKEVNIPEVKTSYEYVSELCERLEDSLKLAQEELQKSQKRYKKHYDKKAKPRHLEVGDQVLILLLRDSNKLLLQWRGLYIVGASSKYGSKTKTYYVNMLKKYFAREPEEDVIHTSNKDDATTAVAGVIYQDTDPELGEVPEYHQKEGGSRCQIR